MTDLEGAEEDYGEGGGVFSRVHEMRFLIAPWEAFVLRPGVLNQALTETAGIGKSHGEGSKGRTIGAIECGMSSRIATEAHGNHSR